MNWREIIAGADERLTEAEAEARELIEANAVELAREQWGRGLQARERLLSHCGGKIQNAIGELRAAEQELRAIAVAVHGPINGQSVVIDPLLDELGVMLDRVGGLEPARIAVMTPYPDEEPNVVRKNGQWARAAIAGDINPDEQPERVQRPPR